MEFPVLRPKRGRDSVDYIDPHHPHRPLVLHTYRPKAHRADDRLVLVQHGIRRNGDEYRDFWIEAAERHRLLVVATTFGEARFPKPANYNNGRVLDEEGTVRPREEWLYGILPRIMEALRAGGVARRPKAWLFGHSAGGQFVHRLLATQDSTFYEAVAVGNAGWYTLPTFEKPFPGGLGGLGLKPTALARWLQYPMAIFAGDRDTDTADANLPREPEAMAQGPMRFARAHYMLDYGQEAARKLGVPCHWTLVPVEGVGHDGAAISRAVADHWFR